jgi:probable addiction module antidote protein
LLGLTILLSGEIPLRAPLDHTKQNGNDGFSPQMRKKFNAAEYVGQPAMIAKYLNEAISTGDLGNFTKALGVIARSHGASKLARELRVDRQTFYRAFDGKATPQIDTVFNTLAALGLQLLTKPRD